MFGSLFGGMGHAMGGAMGGINPLHMKRQALLLALGMPAQGAPTAPSPQPMGGVPPSGLGRMAQQIGAGMQPGGRRGFGLF